jgi:hypothetical protein
MKKITDNWISSLLDKTATCSVFITAFCFIWSFFTTKEFFALTGAAVVALLVLRLPIWLKINWFGMSTSLLILNTVILMLQPQSSVAFDNGNSYVAIGWCFILIFSIIYAEILFRKIYATPKEKRNKFFSWIGYIVTICVAGIALNCFVNVDYSLKHPLTIVMFLNYIPILMNTITQYHSISEDSEDNK